jgi:hypothetical protein
VRKKSRSLSVSEAIRIRMAQTRPPKISPASTLHGGRDNEATSSSASQPEDVGTIEAVPVSNLNSSDSDRKKVATEATTPVTPSEKAGTRRSEKGRSPSWWENLTKRKRKETEREHNV